jgi:hypothetical protein
MDGTDEKCVKNFVRKSKTLFRDLGTDGRIILT